jgi:hypothetical protein
MPVHPTSSKHKFTQNFITFDQEKLKLDHVNHTGSDEKTDDCNT